MDDELVVEDVFFDSGDLYGEHFEVDELEVVASGAQTDVLPSRSGLWGFLTGNVSSSVSLGASATILFFIVSIFWALRPRKSYKNLEERHLVESVIASRIRSVPIEELEKVLYAGCLEIQHGCGAEIDLLFVAQSRLTKEIELYEDTAMDAGADSNEEKDDEYKNDFAPSRRRKATMKAIHLLLKNIEGYMNTVLNMLPQENTAFNLQHRDEQIYLMKSITQLNILLEPIRDKIEINLFSTLPHKVTEYAAELRRSVRKAREAETNLREKIEGKQVLGADSEIEITQFSEQDISSAKVEFEIALRSLVEGSAYLSTYDKATQYEALLREARTLSSTLYAFQDQIERENLEVRLERERSTLKENMITDAEDTFLALKEPSVPSTIEYSNAETLRMTSDNFPHKGAMDAQSLSLIYSNYILANQGRRKDLEDGAIKRQEEREQRRLDFTVSARQAAESQYNGDTEAEVDKKIKLAGLSLQRSSLKVADKGWAEARKRDLEQAYTEFFNKRRRQDLWFMCGALLLMTIGFCITAFKCDVVGGLRQALEQATWQFCSLLSQQACEAEGERMEKAEAQLGFSSSLGRITSLFYGTLSTVLKEGFTKAILLSGLDFGSWALPEGMACLIQALLRMTTPYLAFKSAQLVGFKGTYSLSILITGAYLSFAEAAHSLIAMALSGPCAVLAGFHVIGGATAYFVDSSLHWSGPSGRSSWRLVSSGHGPMNYRSITLFILYPAVMMAVALFLGCLYSSRSFSRGVQLGKRIDLSELFMCIPYSLRRCVEI